MELINPLAEAYAERFTTELSPAAGAAANYTFREHPKAHMCSGPLQGMVLEMISKCVQPKYILEIGTFTGLSAICLAKGLQPTGELHTIEIREQDAETAKNFFDKDTHTAQIKLHVGEAKEIIPTLDYTWDLVFLDADKVSYIDYYELTLPRMRSGGIILADNVLFHGEVLSHNISGKNAVAIHAFNEHVKADPRTEQAMLTVRDGLLMIRKK